MPEPPDPQAPEAAPGPLPQPEPDESPPQPHAPDPGPARAIAATSALAALFLLVAWAALPVGRRYYAEEPLNPFLIRLIGVTVLANVAALISSLLHPLWRLGEVVARKARGRRPAWLTLWFSFMPAVVFLCFHIATDSWLWRLYKVLVGKKP